MNRQIVISTVESDFMRCSNCASGDKIVVRVSGGRFKNDGTETAWALSREIPVGQTRNCFNRFQQIVGLAGNKFIYPNENDSCINHKKFQLK